MSFLTKIHHWTQKSRFFNTIFTPSFLLYTTFVVVFSALYLNFGQAIKNRWEIYSYVLVLISLLIFLRSFVITFSNLRSHLQKNRGFSIGFDTLLFAGVVYLASFSLYFSREDSQLVPFFILFSVSSAIFYIQLFLSQSQPLLKTTFLNFAFYVFAVLLFYSLTRLTDFGYELDARWRWMLVNAVIFFAGVFEIYVFFQAMRYFFKNNIDESAPLI